MHGYVHRRLVPDSGGVQASSTPTTSPTSRPTKAPSTVVRAMTPSGSAATRTSSTGSSPATSACQRWSRQRLHHRHRGLGRRRGRQQRQAGGEPPRSGAQRQRRRRHHHPDRRPQRAVRLREQRQQKPRPRRRQRRHHHITGDSLGNTGCDAFDRGAANGISFNVVPGEEPLAGRVEGNEGFDKATLTGGYNTTKTLQAASNDKEAGGVSAVVDGGLGGATCTFSPASVGVVSNCTP